MGKRVKLILAIVIILLLGFTAYIGFEINKSLTNIMPQEATRKNEKDLLTKLDFDLEAFQKANDYEEIKLKNPKGKYDFSVDSYRLKEGGDVFILIHPMGGTSGLMAPFAQAFLDRGYSVLSYDQMNSGHHPLKKNTFGVREKEDLIALVNYLKEKNPEKKINVYAASYGCNTFLQAYPSIHKDLDRIILDSPMAVGEYYIDMGLKEASKQAKLPFGFFRGLGNMASKVLEGYSYKDTNGLDKVKTITQPILIISNEKDEVTPRADALAIYKRAVGKKSVVDSHSKHANMYFDEQDRYLKELDRFLGENPN